MKKYISLAALLVAGAAFANAEVVLEEADLTSLRTITNISYDGWDGGETDTGTLISKGTYLGVGTLSFNFTLGTEMGYLSEAPECNLVTIRTQGNVTDKVGYGFFISGSDLIFGRVDCGTGGDATPTLDDDTNSDNFSRVTVATELMTGFEYSVAIDLNRNATSVITYSTMGIAQAVDFDAKGLNGNSFGSLRVGDSDFSAIGGGKISNLTVIPEPSAFGLLAGLGALALVGARRRRR